MFAPRRKAEARAARYKREGEVVGRALEGTQDAAVLGDALSHCAEAYKREHSKLAVLQGKASSVVTQAGVLGTIAFTIARVAQETGGLPGSSRYLFLACGPFVLLAVVLGVLAPRIRPMPDLTSGDLFDAEVLPDSLKYRRFLARCYWDSTLHFRDKNADIAQVVQFAQWSFLGGFILAGAAGLLALWPAS